MDRLRKIDCPQSIFEHVLQFNVERLFQNCLSPPLARDASKHSAQVELWWNKDDQTFKSHIRVEMKHHWQ
jgi:hypothetical protein